MKSRATKLTAAALALAAATTGTACKGDKQPEAAAKTAEPTAPAVAPKAAPEPAPAAATAPAATTPAAPAGDGKANLAIAAPKGTSLSLPHANVEALDAALDGAALAQRLTDDNRDGVGKPEQLGDGWAIRYKDDAVQATVVARNLGGAAVLCTTTGENQAEHDLGREACLALRADGGSIVAPLTIGADKISVNVGDVMIGIAIADADSPATAAAETAAAKGLKVLRTDPVPGGFAIAYQAWNGGIEAQGLMYDAKLRAKIGALDVECSAFAGAKSADAAVKTLDACRALRTP